MGPYLRKQKKALKVILHVLAYYYTSTYTSVCTVKLVVVLHEHS